MKKLSILLIFVSFLMACSSTKNLTETSLTGSTWKYIDEDDKYEITFGEDGKLITTHPNDVTPDNDIWSQDGALVHFEYNDGYSKYDGVMKSTNKILGEAKNSRTSWAWKLKRIK
jgi:hypothetical protein